MPGNVLPLITGSAGALVVLALVAWAFYAGKLHSDTEFAKLEAENANLRAALDTERTAVNEASRTGAVTNQLINALTTMAAQQGHTPDGIRRQLTGEDVSL